MSSQVTTAFVKQFEGNIRLLAQQKASRFRGAVRVENINGEEAFFDQVGSVSATLKETRHGNTPLVDTPHSRRQVSTATYEHADLIDVSDRVRLLVDPGSTYSQAFAGAFGRAMDDVIIAAADGDAKTGKTGSTTTSFDSGFNVAESTTGLTTAKVMAAKQLLDENENEGPYFLATTAEQVKDLLTEEIPEMAYAPAANGDFATKMGLMTGELSQWGGFNFIRSERLTKVSTVRSCLAWTKNDLLLGIGKDITARISERSDKSYSTQVFMTADFGATRMSETGVVEIGCVEAA